MKLREWLEKARVRLVEGEGERQVDNVDGLTTMTGHQNGAEAAGTPGADAPPNWVPSQQDWGRPRH